MPGIPGGPFGGLAEATAAAPASVGFWNLESSAVAQSVTAFVTVKMVGSPSFWAYEDVPVEVLPTWSTYLPALSFNVIVTVARGLSRPVSEAGFPSPKSSA